MTERHSFSFLVISILVTQVCPELRFCHYGPQRVSNGDCPYGILLKQPLKSSCLYYANDQSGPGADAEVAMCKAASKNIPAYGERLEDQQFQAVFYEVSDPNDHGEMGRIGSECEECLSHWVDPDERPPGGGIPPPPEEPEYDDMLEPMQPEDEEYHKNLTIQQFISLFEDERPTMAYMRSAKLLNRSFEIMRRACSPFIPTEFMDQVYKGFMFLVMKSRDKVNDLGAFEKKEVDAALERCNGKQIGLEINLTGIICNNYTRILGYTVYVNGSQGFEDHQYTVESKSFRWGKYDPIIESAWMAMDFVHGYCFEDFRPDLNMHHIYQASIEPLFTRTIMQRWPYPPKLRRGDAFWNNLLEVKDAKIMMQNMDACVQFGYARSPFKNRLNRPFNKYPATIGDSATGDGAAANSAGDRGGGSGWKGTVDEYWDWYNKNNGFQDYLKLVGGTCLKSEGQLNEIRTKFEQVCSGT